MATPTRGGAAYLGVESQDGVLRANVAAKSSYQGGAWVNLLEFVGDGRFYDDVIVNGTLKVGAFGEEQAVSLSGHTHEYSPTSHTHSYAPTIHTHDYLPLSGGTLTGALQVNGTIRTAINTSTTVGSTYYIDVGLWMDTTALPAAPAANTVRLALRKAPSSFRNQLVAVFPDGSNAILGTAGS